MDLKASIAFALILIFTIVVPDLPLLAQDAGSRTGEIHNFLREYPELSEDEIQGIEDGKAFAKILKSQEKEIILVFGAVYINISPKQFVQEFSNIEQLEDGRNYLVVERFGNPPATVEFERLSLELEDIKDLKDCEPGDCQIQLPREGIEAFRKKIDWNAPDVPARVNLLLRELAIKALQDYQNGGNGALGSYQDQDKEVNIAEALEGLLSHLTALPAYLPELHDYLLNYPEAQLEGVEDFFYWEKVEFGLKQTVRANHVSIYPFWTGSDQNYAIATKQLYASHYFRAALDMWLCINHPERPGFYLITSKISRQHGLTGFKGRIIRKHVTAKTRESIEKALARLKEKFEVGKEPG